MAAGALSDSGRPLKLYLGSSGEGFLSAAGVPTERYWYRRSSVRLLTLFTYLISQVLLFWKLVFDRTIERKALIYVNTLLPFGAALYGKLTKRKVIYHLHEVSVTPGGLKWFLVGMARRTSSLNIYVSDAHMAALPIPGVRATRIYNALDVGFVGTAAESAYSPRHEGVCRVLMISYLRDYKGIPELLTLAKGMTTDESVEFHLVVNDDESAIGRYLPKGSVPRNLFVHGRTSDVAPFYRDAGLVLNLSRVDECVETFGMTVLEAMAFGIPVIVPPVGGPAELVEDGVHGFLVNSRDATRLRERTLLLMRDQALCLKMSAACRARAAQFLPEVFAKDIVRAVAEAAGGGG